MPSTGDRWQAAPDFSGAYGPAKRVLGRPKKIERSGARPSFAARGSARFEVIGGGMAIAAGQITLQNVVICMNMLAF